jgi:hypothetical protein
LPERLLMTLMYLRLYVRQSLPGYVFDLDESNVSRELHQRLLPILLEVLPVPLREAPLRHLDSDTPPDKPGGKAGPGPACPARKDKPRRRIGTLEELFAAYPEIEEVLLDATEQASGWKAVAVADMNGDGKPDLIFQNSTSGQMQVWYLNGATVTGSAVLSASAAAGWTGVGPKTMDFLGRIAGGRIARLSHVERCHYRAVWHDSCKQPVKFVLLCRSPCRFSRIRSVVMKSRPFLCLAESLWLLVLLCLCPTVSRGQQAGPGSPLAQTTFTVSLYEDGTGTIQTCCEEPIPLFSYLDPAHSNVPTFTLPFPIVAGDLLIVDQADGTVSDLVRFPDQGDGTASVAQFYSELPVNGETPKASDVGIPSDRQPNLVTLVEGLDGVVTYRVDDATYIFHSDPDNAVPEPGALSLLAGVCVCGLGWRWHRGIAGVGRSSPLRKRREP